ncbi:MAG TPA: GNAT family N-acetyltransferase [Anaeromyxobacteraceae bacterium]|jgi:predicted GNAT family N-acyltransferase|nr:GNAT family N-acetyltransferase [Anaeromyxobacteraceae bacterium]
MNVRVKVVETPAEREASRELRRRVFVEEQRVPPELEYDALDETADHVLALDEAGACVGTGRLVTQSPGVGRVGRMAVEARCRGGGIGAKVLAELERLARARGLAEIVLHAQVHAQPFYDRAGYLPEGDRFEEAGIAHVSMRKRL